MWGQVMSMSENTQKPIPYDFVESVVKKLSGNVLTIIDAVTTEEKQNKAIKDLVKEAVRDSFDKLQDYAFDSSRRHGVPVE